jgi:hypothetical protein
MKYFPGSKVGASFAGAYLLVLIILLLVATFGEAGLHAGNGYIAGLLLFALTLPLSGVGVTIDIGPVFLVMLVIGALFNAAIIYLVTGALGKLMQSLFNRFR